MKLSDLLRPGIHPLSGCCTLLGGPYSALLDKLHEFFNARNPLRDGLEPLLLPVHKIVLPFQMVFKQQIIGLFTTLESAERNFLELVGPVGVELFKSVKVLI